MGDVTVTTKMTLESGYMVYIDYDDNDQIELSQGSATRTYSKKDAMQLILTLNAYIQGFEWPPAPAQAVKDDEHVSFPEDSILETFEKGLRKQSSQGPVA